MAFVKSSIAAIVVLAALIAVSCTRQDEPRMFRKSSSLMDTVVTVTVVSTAQEEAEAAIDAAFSEIERLEKLLSFWTEDSEIALINRNAGKTPVKVSPETLEIVDRSIYIARSTDGAFDPTIGPVIRKWNFWEKTIPDEESLKEAVDLVDYRQVETDGEGMTAYLRDEKMSFDTGGIAKGYAADRAVEVLRGRGVKAALVAVAGDIRAFGRRPDGESWTVGIRDPRSDDPEKLIATLDLSDEAVSTSGDYERFFEKDGVRYHHLLDPRTGYPAMGCASVTVIAPEAVLTDGFSTGIFVMGPERGLERLEKLGLEGVIITTHGQRLVTPGLKDRIRWQQPL